MYSFTRVCLAGVTALAIIEAVWAAPTPPAIGIGRGGQIRGRNYGNPPPPSVGIGRGGEIRGRTYSNPAPPAIGIGRGGQIRGSTPCAVPAPPVVRGTNPPAYRIPAPPVVRGSNPPAYRIPAPPAVRGSAASANDGCGDAAPCVPAPPTVTQSGMHIERLSSPVVFPGDTLVIDGENFGTDLGHKIVAINGNGFSYDMEVLEWSDQTIRARVPAGPSAGGARVLIYYDDSLEASSNSQPVTVLLDRLLPR